MMLDKSNVRSFASKQQEKRIIIFIDILGFSHFINNISYDDEINLQDTYRILEKAANIGSREITGVFHPSFTFFSDTIVISWPIDSLDRRTSLILAITQAEQIQRQFLQAHNLLSRGVIHIGQLYHNHPILYGSGLVEAYVEESKNVINPCIVLTRQVLDFFGVIDLHDITVGRYLRNNDGQFFIFFLNFLQNETAVNDVLEFKKLIELNLHQANEEGILKKWLWMTKHFNEHVLYWHDFQEIRIPWKLNLKLIFFELRHKICSFIAK
ncbi:hypothetical protein SC438_07625 [Legionella pneumophila]